MTEKASQPIVELIGDCLHWLSGATAALFYKGEGQAFEFSLPKAYRDWAENPQTDTNFQSSLLAQLHYSAETLQKSLVKASQNRPPQRADFQAFMQAFEDFMARLHPLEGHAILSEQGIDALTGFKTAPSMEAEFKKELDRRARRGSPFSIAMMRIDGKTTGEELNFQLQSISTSMRRCMRSFDDIYRTGEKDFVAGLKHSDLAGGFRFIERVKDDLKILGVDLTFSACVAEPDPSDELKEFLENMEYDLARAAASGKGEAVRFEDVSPLQRFVKSLKNT